MAYSNGFNPHIQVTFASALSTGACGLREIMDVKMASETTEAEFLRRMNEAMPREMQLSAARAVDDRHPALMASLRAGMYEIILRDKEQAERLIRPDRSHDGQETIPVNRKTKSGIREVDMKPLIYALRGERPALRDADADGEGILQAGHDSRRAEKGGRDAGGGRGPDAGDPDRSCWEKERTAAFAPLENAVRKGWKEYCI